MNVILLALCRQVRWRELAKLVNVTPMAISNYESGKRKPDMELLMHMANVLGVRVSDFLAVRNENLVFCHGEFRKNSTLSVTLQEYVRESVEEYFNRFMTIVEILGGDVLPIPPATNILELTCDSENDAQALRKHLNLAVDGPIFNLIEVYISSDTNVWIDFSVIGRIELPFRLPYTYMMNSDALMTNCC